MYPIVNGTQITYIKEDSGQIIPGKIWLVPGEVLTVGKDVPAEFATRLVEDNVCAVVPAKVAEDAPPHNPLPPEPAVALREPMQGEQASDVEKAPEETVSCEEHAVVEAAN